MARVALTVQAISRTGLTNPTQNAANADGNSFANTGRQFIRVTNNNASTRTLTIPIPATYDGQAVTPKTYPILTTQTWEIGPFPTSTYNQTGDVVHLDWSAVTDVTVEVKTLPSS